MLRIIVLHTKYPIDNLLMVFVCSSELLVYFQGSLYFLLYYNQIECTVTGCSRTLLLINCSALLQKADLHVVVLSQLLEQPVL